MSASHVFASSARPSLLAINMASRQASRTSDPAAIRQVSIAKFARASPLRGSAAVLGPEPTMAGRL